MRIRGRVESLLAAIHPYLEADGTKPEIFFVDEDFGAVELLLRCEDRCPPQARLAAARLLEAMLTRRVPGVRSVEFLPEAPPEQESHVFGAPAYLPDEEFLRARTGIDWAAALLESLRRAVREGLSPDAPRTAALFLERAGLSLERTGLLRQRLRSPDLGADRRLAVLRGAFSALESAARAAAHVESPVLLTAQAREDLLTLRRLLDRLRPLLGPGRLEAFLPARPALGGEEACLLLLDRIFADTARRGVRNAYLGVERDSGRLSYRTARRVVAVADFPSLLYAGVLDRLKRLAALDPLDRTRRQEGLIRMPPTAGYGNLAVRVQTVPDRYAERLYLRTTRP